MPCIVIAHAAKNSFFFSDRSRGLDGLVAVQAVQVAVLVVHPSCFPLVLRDNSCCLLTSSVCFDFLNEWVYGLAERKGGQLTLEHECGTTLQEGHITTLR
jgi:hypothetical protein